MLGFRTGTRLCQSAVRQPIHTNYIQSHAFLTGTNALSQAQRYPSCLGTENVQRRTYIRVKVGGNLSQGDTRKAITQFRKQVSAEKIDKKIRNSRFHTKRKYKRQQNEQAKVWWKAKKDVHSIVDRMFEQNQLKFPKF
eukprot:gb/GECG01010646.1/.p1 GENE.gb/GECG01010646.1/~~gb/GECG01010646.1/.p1  ORF type:complete len:138 (+),score=12.61 gb/GECG01010646.1/:1-414(+)